MVNLDKKVNVEAVEGLLVEPVSGEVDVVGVELVNTTTVDVVVTKLVNTAVVVVTVVVTVVMVVTTATAVVMEVVMISHGVVMVMVMIVTDPPNSSTHNMECLLQLLMVVVEKIPEVEPEGQLEGELEVEPEVDLGELAEEDVEVADMLLMPEKPRNFNSIQVFSSFLVLGQEHFPSV